VKETVQIPHDRRRGMLRNANPPGDFSTAPPRCGAKTRCGTPSRCPAMPNGCCRLHGGLSTGPKTERRYIRDLICASRGGFESGREAGFGFSIPSDPSRRQLETGRPLTEDAQWARATLRVSGLSRRDKLHLQIGSRTPCSGQTESDTYMRSTGKVLRFVQVPWDT
jgi:hypothetical protein